MIKQKILKKIMRIILAVLIIIWAIWVWGMSNQNANESSGLSRKVTKIFFKTEEKVEKAEPYIRKTAHFTEYTIGGMLFICFFLTFDCIDIRQKMIYSLSAGVLYAGSDEFHQLFIDGRSGNLKDVCIDSAGVLLGICIIIVLRKYLKKVLVNKVAVMEGNVKDND